MGSDPFGRAVRDYHRGEQSEAPVQVDGDHTEEHDVGRYFESFDGDEGQIEWLEGWLDGPLVDLGAGAGRHALYFQEQFETVALEMSPNLVETMTDRGVEDARRGNMFKLPEQFEAGRFRSALAYGTQAGLARSMEGIRRFLDGLAQVTTPDGTAVIGFSDPDHEFARELVGYRPDPTPGLAHRALHFEYEGTRSKTMLFRLLTPERVEEVTEGTAWTVADVERDLDLAPCHYQVALTKS